MFGPTDRVLYVGQTGNLRVRLGTYKNCNPDHLPRKVLRLVHQVHRIEWQPCDDTTEARLRENHLLRVHRPRFNRTNTFPKAYYFFGAKLTGRELDLWLTNDLNYNEPLFGAFKGNTRQAFGALVMLLWSYLHRPESIQDFPAGILSQPPRAFRFHLQDVGLHYHLQCYLNGVSTELLNVLQTALLPISPSGIQRSLYEAALLTLSEFFESGPRRTRRLREQNGVPENLIAQDRLDDLIVVSRAALGESARGLAHSKTLRAESIQT